MSTFKCLKCRNDTDDPNEHVANLHPELLEKVNLSQIYTQFILISSSHAAMTPYKDDIAEEVTNQLDLFALTLKPGAFIPVPESEPVKEGAAE